MSAQYLSESTGSVSPESISGCLDPHALITDCWSRKFIPDPNQVRYHRLRPKPHAVLDWTPGNLSRPWKTGLNACLKQKPCANKIHLPGNYEVLDIHGMDPAEKNPIPSGMPGNQSSPSIDMAEYNAS